MDYPNMLKWDDHFSVGDDLMDNQHKKFIEILNKFQASFNEGKEIEISINILDELIYYSISHFNDEEEFMKSIDFPGLEDHILLHINFKKKLLEFRNKIRNDHREVHMEIMNFLKKWWQFHIMEKDMRYFDFVDIK
jgi:hemerythrin